MFVVDIIIEIEQMSVYDVVELIVKILDFV